MGALDALLEYTPRLDVENRRVTCELKLSKRVAASILFEIADGIKAAYELSFVRLYPRYDSAPVFRRLHRRLDRNALPQHREDRPRLF